MTTNTRRFLTVKQAVEAGLYPNEGGLRNLLFYAHQNGLERAVRKIGRRTLIDEQKYLEWMDSQRED